MAADGSVIDPHVHLWDVHGTPKRQRPLVRLLGWRPELLEWVARRAFPADLIAFVGTPEHAMRDHLVPDLLASTAGRCRTFVHVQAGWQKSGPMGPVGETRWLESLGAPELGAIVGHADLSLGARVGAVLDAHAAASRRFRGVRHMLANHADPGVHSFCETPNLAWDPEFRRGYEELAKRGLSFDAWAYSHQLDELRCLARDFPEVPMVLDHCGSPVGFGGPFALQGRSAGEREAILERWKADIARLAELDHVCVKLSGLAMPISGFGYHEVGAPSVERLAEDLAPVITHCIDVFGPQRCMFASNFPMDKVSTSWRDLYAAYDRIVADRTDEERHALFAGTATRVYRL